MYGYLRQSTATTEILAVVLDDSGDPVGSIPASETIGAAYKAGSTSGGIALVPADFTFIDSGQLQLALTADDTDTPGQLLVILEDSGFTSQAFIFQVLEEAVYDATYASGATGYATGPPEQEHVPASRTALLNKRLEHEGDPIELTVGDTDLLCAIDFADDIGKGRLATIASVSLHSSYGTADGITFDSSTGTGVDRTIAKFKATAVTAGTYVIVCKVTYDGLAGTRTAHANVTVGAASA